MRQSTISRFIQVPFGIIVLTAVALLTGCGADTAGERAPGDTPQGSTTDAPTAPLQPMVVGLMPAVDTAPMFVAQAEGYFAELGLEVSFELFTSGQDRQSALQTGRIDGAMTDLVAVAVNVAGGFDLKATMLTDGVFPVLAHRDAVDRDRVSIGVMEVSVTNFLVDQWLAADYELEKTFITAVPARLEAVLSGQLDMGIFPEPIASVGELRGLEKLMFEPVDGFSPDVMAFTGTARSEKAREIAAFHAAYDRAVTLIRDDPDRAREAIVSNIPNVPPEIRELIDLPTYHPARLPNDAAVQRIIDWTATVAGDDLAVTVDEMLDRRFVAQ